MLVGKPASSFSIPVKASTTAPPPIPIGLPSQLLERRPDVAGAERNMAAANAQIGVAFAAYYPALTLSGSGGVESSAIKNLLDSASRFCLLDHRFLKPSTMVACAAPRSINTSRLITPISQPIARPCSRFSAGGRLARSGAHPVAADHSRATSRRFVADISEAGAEPLRHRDRSLYRCRHRANHIALQPADAGQSASGRDDQSVQLIQALGGGWDRSELPTPSQFTQKPTHAETTIQH